MDQILRDPFLNTLTHIWFGSHESQTLLAQEEVILYNHYYNRGKLNDRCCCTVWILFLGKFFADLILRICLRS